MRLIIACVMVLITTPALAVDFHVTTPQELQVALTSAANNGSSDTIYLASGVYDASGGFSHLSLESESLTIRPEQGLTAEDVILDGMEMYRVLNLANLEYRTTFTVMNLTIRNGRDPSHGGLYIETPDGDIVVTDCVFHSNEGGKSLAVYAEVTYPGLHQPGQGSIYFQRNSVRDNGFGNYSSVPSAAVSLKIRPNGTMLVEDNVITGNYVTGTSWGAGGLLTRTEGDGIITVRRNTISFNTGPLWGCGGVALSQGKITLTDNTVQGNSSKHDAAVQVDVKSATISGNVISGNTTTKSGWVAGLFLRPWEGAILTNNVVFDNDNQSVNESGPCTGGIYVEAGYVGSVVNLVILTNNTITGNSALTAGGVRANISLEANFHMYNNIVWGNDNPAQNSVDIVLEGFGTKRGFNNNYSTLTGLWGSYADNMNADPRLRGGGNYHLMASSPCIDKGTAVEAPNHDIDGDSRPRGRGYDIGADEYAPTAMPFIPLLLLDE